MRLYTFTNWYLSSVQQGIQPQHLTSEFFVKYPNESQTPDNVLWDWAKNHKTTICLNGGNNAGLLDIYAQLEQICPKANLPFCKFHEDQDSLGGILTCVGIVVPERIYAYNELVRSKATPEAILQYQTDAQFLTHDWALIELLSSYGLAK